MILIIRFLLCWCLWTSNCESRSCKVKFFLLPRKKRKIIFLWWCYIRSRYLFYLALCRIKQTSHNRSLLGRSSLGSAKIIKEFISTTWEHRIVKQITFFVIACDGHSLLKMINCSWVINFKQLFVLKKRRNLNTKRSFR